ncbi:hypothetical protein D3C71_1947250 [compost metagenome]
MLEKVDNCEGWGRILREGVAGNKVGGCAFFIFVAHCRCDRVNCSGQAFPAYNFLYQAISTVSDCTEKTFAICGAFEFFL